MLARKIIFYSLFLTVDPVVINIRRELEVIFKIV